MILRCLRFFGKGLLALLIVLLLYFAGALVCSIIPVNTDHVEQGNFRVYLRSYNGHTDFVFPVQNQVIDWKDIVDPQLTLSKRSNFQYIAIGWGDLELFEQAQQKAYATFPVAFRAVFEHEPAAIHVEFMEVLRFHRPLMPIRLTAEQYKTLSDYVLETFKKNYSGTLQPLRLHYNQKDLFFRARGSLNLFYTCNTWVNRGLKQAELKACLWTPFPEGIFNQYR